MDGVNYGRWYWNEAGPPPSSIDVREPSELAAIRQLVLPL